MTLYKTRLALLVAAMGLLTACSGTPTTQNAAATGGTAQQVADTSDTVRCKTLIKTGTRLGTKVCKTNRQWEQEAQDSADAINDIQRTSTHGPGPEGG